MTKWTEFAAGLVIGAAALYFVKTSGLVNFVDRVDPNNALIFGGGGHY